MKSDMTNNEVIDEINENELSTLSTKLAPLTDTVKLPADFEAENVVELIENNKRGISRFIRPAIAIAAALAVVATSLVVFNKISPTTFIGFFGDETSNSQTVSDSGPENFGTDPNSDDDAQNFPSGNNSAYAANVTSGTAQNSAATINTQGNTHQDFGTLPQTDTPSYTKPGEPARPLGKRLETSYFKNYEEVYDEIIEYKSSNDYKPSRNPSGSTDELVMEGAPPTTAADTSPNNALKGEASEISNNAAEFGGTNNQVKGVEEADIVKNDGSHLYVLSDNKLKIVKASGGNMSAVSTIDFANFDNGNFYPSDFYISGNTLIVCAVVYSPGDSTFRGCMPYWYIEESRIKFYDISDRANPRPKDTFSQQGGNMATRVVGDYIYLVTQYYVNNYELSELDVNNYKSFLPHTSDSSGATKPVAARNIALVPNAELLSYAVVSAVSISDSSKSTTEAYIGASSVVYVSSNNIFVAASVYNTYVANDGATVARDMTPTCNIMRVRYLGQTIQLEAAGTTTGHVIGQFAMDEYNNNLRVVTEYPSNRLTIFDYDLNPISNIDNIAPGENVKSVRFLSDKAYIITFLQIDPLFAIDLSDPYNPRITGELKILGYSYYLHPVGENLLLGVGYDGDEVGANGGLKLCLFDTSDPKKPTLLHDYVYNPSAYNHSGAAYNHKALIFDDKNKSFTIPVVSSTYDEMTESILTFRYDRENGFTLLSNVTGGANPLRGTYIGATAYAIFGDSIIASDRITWQKLSEIRF